LGGPSTIRAKESSRSVVVVNPCKKPLIKKGNSVLLKERKQASGKGKWGPPLFEGGDQTIVGRENWHKKGVNVQSRPGLNFLSLQEFAGCVGKRKQERIVEKERVSFLEGSTPPPRGKGGEGVSYSKGV